MQLLPVHCYYCKWTGEFNTYQSHLDQFHSDECTCNYCGKVFDSEDAFNQHKAFHCQPVTVFCALKDSGCTEKIIHGHLSDHFFTIHHQDSLKNSISKSTLLRSETVDTVVSDPYDNYSQLEGIIGATMTDTVKILSDDVEQLNAGVIKQDHMIEDLSKSSSKLKLSVEEIDQSITATEVNQRILQQELFSIQREIEDAQYTTFDGTLMWKITGVQEKLRDAKSERQTSVYSPPFFSSPVGYKMKARLYLNGDGNARRTHISLFFVLMRGRNDAILKFPFDYKVSFCLYDQSPNQKHIIDSFRPDVRSSSFQRPCSEMNIASGIPKFAPLTLIEKEDSPYVRNDMMFIKIVVDFDNTHKSLLLYGFSLNQGLPTHIQQTLIKAEAQRRLEQQKQHAED